MLIKEVIEPYKDHIDLIVEDWGESELSKKHNIKEYPVVFINDKVFARPEDFGFMGRKGKYFPWYDKSNQSEFQKDLENYLKELLKED